jgi:MFS superfamily sulfate permease-like transporter
LRCARQIGGIDVSCSYANDCSKVRRGAAAGYRASFLLALAGVLFIDVLEGMLIGVTASPVFVIYRSSRPHLSSLGRVPGVPGAYSDLGRHPEDLPVPGVLILRLAGPFYYANALTTRDHIKAVIEAVAELVASQVAIVYSQVAIV